MTLFDVVAAALLQGIAQVLPLGAQGHLLLFGVGEPSSQARLALAVAGHAGAALAICLYFWRDIAAMATGLVKLAKGRPDAGARLFLQVLAGSVPALALGWAFATAGGGIGGPATAAAAMLVFGLFLLVADRLGVTVRRVEHMSWIGAVAIGLLQAAALIPGVSRTGITITAARLMGFERAEAARFSLLLGIPAFAASAIFNAWTLSRHTQMVFTPDLAIAAAAAGLGAMVAITLMMAWVRDRSFAPFALWRILLGGGALAWMWWG